MAETKDRARALLEVRRNQLFAVLAKEYPDIVAEIEDIERHLRFMDSAEVITRKDWSVYNNAIDAVYAYLEWVAKPTSRDQIAADLKAGGYGRLAKRPGFNVLDSIRYHTKPNVVKKRLVVLEGDLIALPEWKLE